MAEKLGTKQLNQFGEWFSNTDYGKRFLEGQERQKELEQELMDQGGIAGYVTKLENTPNPIEEKVFKKVSDITNVDQRITTPALLSVASRLGPGAVTRTMKSIPVAKNIYKTKFGPASGRIVNVKGTKVTPSTSNVTGTTTAGALQSKEGALQTRISQFQAGASKSTRDLNLTTDYAKGSLLKNVSTEISANNGVLPEVLKDVMLARKFKQSPEFLTELATKTTSMKSIFKKHGDEIGYVNLRKMGYKGGDNFITSPKGELFKYEWKDHRWSWRSVDSKKKQTETRLFGMRPDKQSIIPIFQHHYKDLPGGRKIAERQVESYIETNTVVNSEINKALARHNALVKKTKGYNPEDILSLEHIFDVHFYHRLKDLVKTFPGQGANEISNITAMDNPLNMRTGAENKKISIDDAFLKTIKSGKGMTDYDKTIAQFIYHDVGDKVKNFTQAQWDDFLQEVLERQGDTAQEILIDMIKIDDTVQQIKSN